MTVVLDASVLIAHFDPHDAHHDAATRLLIELAGEALMAHPLTIAEVLVGPARVNRAVERRQSLREMRVDVIVIDIDIDIDIDIEAPIRLAILRAQTGLRMPDCLCARRRHIPPCHAGNVRRSPFAAVQGPLRACAADVAVRPNGRPRQTIRSSWSRHAAQAGWSTSISS